MVCPPIWGKTWKVINYFRQDMNYSIIHSTTREERSHGPQVPGTPRGRNLNFLLTKKWSTATNPRLPLSPRGRTEKIWVRASSLLVLDGIILCSVDNLVMQILVAIKIHTNTGKISFFNMSIGLREITSTLYKIFNYF